MTTATTERTITDHEAAQIDRANATRATPVVLERVLWRDGQNAVSRHDIRHVFLMTGADANTEWLQHRVALDAKGFIKCGPDLTNEDLAAAQWPLERAPYLLETSLPGVFAVGDVRCRNIKRVASAVGEGSIAISFVHRVLAESSVAS